MGNLEQARLIENLPLALFPEWKHPFLISTIIWILFFLLTFARSHFCEQDELSWTSRNMKEIFSRYINKTCDSHALTLLAACYLPGTVAAYIQLARGTKYSEFPAWLDRWLKMRKQFGIFMLFSASIHACFQLLQFNPSWHYSLDIPTPEGTSWDWNNTITITGPSVPMDIKDNIWVGAGVIAYFAAAVLGVTSLPSVSSSLSWREFRMIQSWLGWVCLLLASAHCALIGWSWTNLWKFECIFPSSTQLPLVLPAITVLLKIPLVLPCVDSRLTSIRQGKEFR